MSIILARIKDYKDEKYKPTGTLQVTVPEIKFESPRSFNFTSHYHGKNHAFAMSRTVYDYTGKSFVPDLDVRHELMIRVERINKYMDIRLNNIMMKNMGKNEFKIDQNLRI